MSQKLPLKQIFLKGITMPIQKNRELLRLGWPYITIFLVSSLLIEKPQSISISIAYFVLLALTGTLAAVGCHRVFLLPSQSVAEMSTFRWRSRETKFLLSLLGIIFLSGLISVPLIAFLHYLKSQELFTVADSGLLSFIVDMLLIMPATYIVSRWSLVLPDTAVDHDNTFSWAWNLSSGHSIRLFFLIGVIPIAMRILFVFIDSFVEPSHFFTLVESMVWLVVAAIEICLLSLSYDWIVSN